MTALLVLSGLLLPFWWVTLLKAARAARRRTGDWVTADEPLAVAEPRPKVSILIAARDEEGKVGPCVDSLRAQTYPNFEVIIVDDRSSDRTFDEAKQHAGTDERFTVIRTEALPEGWFGKPHALGLAAARATGEWLLLTDADTLHRERSVENGLAFALRNHADAVSLVGEIVHPTTISNLVTPQLYAIIAASIERKRRTDGETFSTACGGWFLIARAALDRAGGMEGVKAEVAEDRALARELSRSGARYAFGVGAPALWRTTSYATLAEIHRGFARNVHLQLNGLPRLAALSLLIWLLALTPTATAVATVLSFDALPAAAALFGLLQYVFVLWVQAYVRRLSHTRWWLAPLAPVGGLLAWLLLMRWSFGRARIEWKGRTYPA